MKRMQWRRFASWAWLLPVLGSAGIVSPAQNPPPAVVQINLDGPVEPVVADFVLRGIQHANAVGAAAILLELSTPGGLDQSMREIIKSVENSRVPVITYVAPSGSRAASAGFFILLAGDVAVMAPGTNTGAAHPVVLGGMNVGETMKTKILNDAAAYIRAIAGKRGRNAALAEAAVRDSKSYTDQEALQGHLVDAVASSPAQIFDEFNGKTIARFDGAQTTLRLESARLELYPMGEFDRFLSWLADPNIAFILGALGLLLLYIEFTHPGMVAPGVFGAIALVLALFAFHLMPVNYVGVVLILIAVALFALEAKFTSHGVLAIGGIIAMTLGALILVKSPWPGAGIRFSTSLGVTLPLAVISIILMRLAWKAKLAKTITGEAGLIDSRGVARTDLAPEGEVFVHGEIWRARAAVKIPSGTRVRIRAVEGLTLYVEPDQESH